MLIPTATCIIDEFKSDCGQYLVQQVYFNSGIIQLDIPLTHAVKYGRVGRRYKLEWGDYKITKANLKECRHTAGLLALSDITWHLFERSVAWAGQRLDPSGTRYGLDRMRARVQVVAEMTRRVKTIKRPDIPGQGELPFTTEFTAEDHDE